jgi:bacterioferritin-associated ferredoxin
MKNISDYPKYEKISKEQIEQMAAAFNRYLGNMRETLGVGENDVAFCEETLLEIIELVWKRHIYFQVFHELDGLNELKEVSLYCFWILKMQPFAWINPDKPNYKLNSIIALQILTKGLHFYAEKKGKRVNINKLTFEELYYSFRYRDWSKEAIMDLASCLVI